MCRKVYTDKIYPFETLNPDKKLYTTKVKLIQSLEIKRLNYYELNPIEFFYKVKCKILRQL
ncbi:hypothetical protein LBMAG27_05580 [Bacteroidota bacterium]|nr:hypothetical protein LBMAG27_05580 [Bacteroidota bacterium]